MRKTVSLVLAVGLLAALAACSPTSTSATTTVDGCAPAQPGTVSDAVKVTGKYGTEPKVKITTPVKATATERTVITQGKGKVAKKGASVNVDIALYSGSTGKELSTSGFNGKTFNIAMDTAKFLPGLVKTLECSTIGSRVVGVIPPKDAFGSTGSSSLGIGAKDSIVVIADVVSLAATPLARATGDPQPPVAGLPTVVLDAKGIPTVTIPNTKAPTAFQEGVLIKGKGAVVGSNVNVVVNYQLYLWRTKKVVAGNDTYSAGQTATFNTGQVVPGFKQAIEGQTIGSQVIVVIPPALGYGKTGSSAAGITGTDDLVFVIDILGVN